MDHTLSVQIMDITTAITETKTGRWIVEERRSTPGVGAEVEVEAEVGTDMKIEVVNVIGSVIRRRDILMMGAQKIHTDAVAQGVQANVIAAEAPQTVAEDDPDHLNLDPDRGLYPEIEIETNPGTDPCQDPVHVIDLQVVIVTTAAAGDMMIRTVMMADIVLKGADIDLGVGVEAGAAVVQNLVDLDPDLARHHLVEMAIVIAVGEEEVPAEVAQEAPLAVQVVVGVEVPKKMTGGIQKDQLQGETGPYLQRKALVLVVGREVAVTAAVQRDMKEGEMMVEGATLVHVHMTNNDHSNNCDLLWGVG